MIQYSAFRGREAGGRRQEEPMGFAAFISNPRRTDIR